MDYGLKDKVALVLASSDGLGAAVAMELAKEGAKVMINGRSEEKLLNTAKLIKEESGNSNVKVFAADLTKADMIHEMVVRTEQVLGPVYALFNNAGGPPAGSILSFSDEEWYQAFDLTLLSYVRVMREVAPIMRQQGGGRILNSTSSSVKAALFNLGLSNTIRAGIVGLSKTVSQEEGGNNILCNVIAPGRIATERIDHLDQMRAQKSGKTVEEIQTAAWKEIPLGRYGRPEEYGKIAAFLLSPVNTYITGQTLLVDGGLVKAL